MMTDEQLRELLGDLMEPPEDWDEWNPEPEQMLLCEINEDNTVHVCYHNRKDPIPDGMQELPIKYKGKGKIHYINGEFVEIVKTKEEKDKEVEYDQKIEAKIRELAIKELKKEGGLPEDYKEK